MSECRKVVTDLCVSILRPKVTPEWVSYDPDCEVCKALKAADELLGEDAPEKLREFFDRPDRFPGSSEKVDPARPNPD